MRTLTLAAAALLLLCIAPIDRPVVAADNEIYTNTEYGFKIDKPEGWTFSEPPIKDGIKYSMKFAEVKDNKETSVAVMLFDTSDYVNNANEARNAIETTWRDNDALTNIKKGNGKYAKTDAPWLKGVYDVGDRYVIRQHFLLHDEQIFILQTLAPEKDYKETEKTLTALLESFDFVPVDLDRERLIELAGYCGTEVKWAGDWAQASRRARTEDKLVMVVFEVYRGLLDSQYSLSSLFMFPDIVELVNERFVPVFWTPDIGAPFDDPRVFGLGPSTFGNGLMFASKDGKIVGQATTLNPDHIYDRCREMLKLHPGGGPENDSDPTELLRRGDLEAAKPLLSEPDIPEAFLLQGTLNRRLRDGEAALKSFDGAKGSDTEKALVHLNMGEFSKADKLLSRAKDPRGMFLHCVARANLKGFEAVEPKLREIALEHSSSRWGWWAAALVVEERLQGVLKLFTWPTAEQFDSWNMPAYELPEDVESARTAAMKFLLLKQGADGRWVNPRSAQGGIFDVAVSSICARSLLPYKEDAVVLSALKRTHEYILEQELKAVPDALFDYTIWAQIFALDFLAGCNEAEIGSRTKNTKAMKAIIKDMQTHQYPGGGWGYFHHADAPDNTIGFVTGAAILSLQHAEKAGAKLPPRMLSKAADSIAALAHPSGSFGYMWMAGKGDMAKQAEASLRSPLYALALKRTGKLDAAGVRKALDVYMKHREHVIKERGKSVCHTGPEGTAPYYLLFGYRFAAEAVGELADEEQAKYREALLKDIRQFGMSDGSFCDYQSVGREYGAAMALTAVDLLGE